MKNFLRSAAFVSLLAFTAVAVAPGCATVGVAIPIVLAVVQGAELAVNAIESFVNAYYAANPNPGQEKLCHAAIAKTRVALAGLNDLTLGVGAVDQGQLTAAFGDFEAAYTDLLALVGPIGVHVGTKGMRAMPGGGLEVPPASAFRPRSK